MLSCYCPLTRLHMLFRLVPWKAIWANGSLEFVVFGLRYVVIVLSNTLLALAWLALVSAFLSVRKPYPLTVSFIQSIVFAFNNVVRFVLRIPPSQPLSHATSSERDVNGRSRHRKIRRPAKLSRINTPRPPPTKSAVRTGQPTVVRHVSFTREDIEPSLISHTVSAPPVRVRSNERLQLSISPVVEENEREGSTSSSTASPDSISPLPTLEHDSVSSRSVSPDVLPTGEGNKVHSICRSKAIPSISQVLRLISPSIRW